MIKVTVYGFGWITGLTFGLEYIDAGEEGFAIVLSLGICRLMIERYSLNEEDFKEEDLYL